jgi:hypothetical protein
MVAGQQGMEYIYFIAFVHGKTTRLRKATTSQTQTLVVSQATD